MPNETDLCVSLFGGIFTFLFILSGGIYMDDWDMCTCHCRHYLNAEINDDNELNKIYFIRFMVIVAIITIILVYSVFKIGEYFYIQDRINANH